MANSHHNHHRRAASGTKKQLPPHARASKPAPLTKRTVSSSKSAQKAAVPHHSTDLDDESMAVSFLQFCATCEKQIIVPSNSLLYCSESCRKRDKSMFTFADYSPPDTPFGKISPEDLPVRDIVPPRSPTAAPLSNRSSLICLSDTDNEPTSPDGYQHERQGSEAARYLRQFQSVAAAIATISPDRPARPGYNRSHSAVTAAATHSAAPSLSHTPHSVCSMAGMPFTPLLNTSRPLPPRKNPYSSSYGSRSTDLVTPFTASVCGDAYPTTTSPYNERAYCLKSAPSAQACVGFVAEGEISYEKRETLPVAMVSPGSLGQLFAGRSPPPPSKWIGT